MSSTNTQQPVANDGPSVTTESISIPMDQEPSNEGSGTVTESDVTKFISPAPASESVLGPSARTVAMPPAQVDGDIASFLRRPVEIYDLTWTGAAPVATHIDPWQLYLSDSRVRDKIANYKYLRADLRLEVIINGTPFHYGRLLVSYEPRNGRRAGAVVPVSVDGDFRQHSCLPHVMIDPTTNTVGLLTAPFIHPLNWIDLQDPDGAQLGILNIDTIADLKIAAAGAVPDVRMHIMAWMENVDLSYPTNGALATFVAQGDEYTQEPNSGVISGPLSKIAGWASYLGEAPVIGPFAKATEMTAAGGAMLARLFGFSKPRILVADTTMIEGVVGNMANTDAADSSTSLTINSKSELSIDPKTVGLDIDHDELAIASFVNKWTCCPQTFPYVVGSTANILSLPVEPNVGHDTSGGFDGLTAMGYAARAFQQWRGSIQFEFTVVCSRYHRGRLRVTYEPSTNGVGAPPNSQLNTNYTRIVDISDTTVFCITIPYFSAWGWTGTQQAIGNLYIDSVNPLAAPVATADATIFYRVRGGEDFALANPTNEHIRLDTTYSTEGDERVDDEACCVMLHQVQGDVDLRQAAERECVDITMFTAPTPPHTDDVYMADPVRSFRTLIKRYEFVYSLGNHASINTSTTGEIRTTIPAFPPPRGKYLSLGWVNSIVDTISPTQNTILQHVERCFLGKRGSMRYILNNFSNHRYESDQLQFGHPVVSKFTSRNTTLRPRSDVTNLVGIGTDGSDFAYIPESIHRGAAYGDSAAGVTMFPKDGSSGRSIQVEVPFYSCKKYATGFGRDSSSQWYNPSAIQISQRVTQYSGAARSVQQAYDVFAAAGEDFTCFFFLGPPRIYQSGLYSSADFAGYTGTIIDDTDVGPDGEAQ